MSGNPFRRTPELSDSEKDVQIALSEDISPGQGQSRGSQYVTKRVRIATPPPLSPVATSPTFEEYPFPARQQSHFLNSPPQTARDVFSSSSVDDPGSANASDIEFRQEIISGTKDGSGARHISSGFPVTSVLVNPFERTLASIQASDTRGDLIHYAESTDLAAGSQSQSSKSGRNTMDVDAFKRLLMTGSTAPDSSRGSSVSTAPSNPPSHQPVDSSTDTSSVSRHSLFDSLQDTSETPRTSYEAYPSDFEEQASSLTGNLELKRNKPPVPKHRHGKQVAVRIPQTVSFIDFEQSHTPQSAAAQSHIPRSPDTIKARPVPSLRSDDGSSNVTSKRSDDGSSNVTSKQCDSIMDPSDAKTVSINTGSPRVPPPPPLARRSSQLRRKSPQSNQTGTSSLAALSNSDEVNNDSLDSAKLRPILSTPSKVPPPPPSRRRSGSASNTMLSGFTEPISPSSTTGEGLERSLWPSGEDSGVEPPIVANADSSRSSSTSNRLSMAPPPPPPRRQRGSSRASIEIPKAVLPSPDTSRRSSLHQRDLSANTFETTFKEQDLTSVTTSTDVLADLSALQAEVEALRSKYRRLS